MRREKNKEAGSAGSDGSAAPDLSSNSGASPSMDAGFGSDRSSGIGEKVLKGSFGMIAAIHITVFTFIGVTTRQWRLLVIFLVGFVLVMGLWALYKLWRAKKVRRETRK